MLYPLSEDLKLQDFSKDSKEYELVKSFNDHYNEMLAKIEAAIGLMIEMSGIAEQIVTLPNTNNKDKNLRPVFDYIK